MIVGIDLGTTNSAVGIWRDGAVELIPNSLGDLLTPSAVSLSDDGRLLVGRTARDRQSTHPKLTTTAFKRYMGTTRKSRLGDQSFLPEELSALVLRALKADAEAYLGEAVTEAVIAVPAYFNDKQRKATRKAGELAGLKVERLVNEPTAAALSYGLHQRDQNARFLVFDLGGGTFDVSILELFEGVVEVRASTGDNRLGGEDFNALLIERAKAQLSPDERDEAHETGELYQKIRFAAERARRELTQQPEATMTFVWDGHRHELAVSGDEFEIMAEGLLARLREPVLRAMRDGGLRSEALDEIVLVGGATRMPVVRRAVTKMFGRFPATAVDPDEAIVRGAAIQAGLKARDAALNDVVLTDVCPYTLGVDVGEIGPGGVLRTGLYSPIIERNTVIPASRVQTYSTLQDNQKQVQFNIYQGEARWVAENIPLGRISVAVPPAPAGQVEVECRFTYDINGLLEVDVAVPGTKERKQLVIGDESLPPQDLDKRRAELAALKVHPRDSDPNRAALSRAGRCYEEHIGDARTYVSSLIAEFEGVLDRQDPRHAETARKALMEALDQLEGAVYL